jgi:N-acetylneuraminic acid mutarotase
MKTLKLFGLLLFAVMLLLPSTSGVAKGAFPSARSYAQMTYDSESGLVVLYGGGFSGDYQDPATWSHETWTYNPRTNVWKQKFPAATPGGHSGGDMTYDSKADRSILSIFSDDWSEVQTWTYDANTNTWERRANGPRLLVGQRIAYDSESDRIILFGGWDLAKLTPGGLVNETWAYDYNTDTWTNMAPSFRPQIRNYQGMVYYSKADRVVMWGGAGVSVKQEGLDYAEIWTYDYNTNTWESLENKKDSPDPRVYIMLAYDDRADKIIMYGGYDYGNDETWVYDLNTQTWQQMHPVQNPGMLSRYSMVYVKDIDRTILLGGQDGSSHSTAKPDIWSYNLRLDRWTNITPGQ